MTTITEPTSPTSCWLAHATGTLDPLAGAPGVAERILLLLHYGIDWETSWVGARRVTYWDRHLPDRVLVATYQTDSLRTWWTQVAGDLVSSPRGPAERAELARLLEQPSAPVLRALREQTEALVLRTRIVAELVRAGRPNESEPAPRTARTPSRRKTPMVVAP